MANILGDDKKQQVLALGQLSWTLRRIQEATGVRRETASAYLKAAGIAMFELTVAEGRVQIVEERHYKLVPKDQITAEDLRTMAREEMDRA